jgi:hypothetical protein
MSREPKLNRPMVNGSACDIRDRYREPLGAATSSR